MKSTIHHIQRDSIPSSRDVALSYDAGRGRGVGFLLSQCLSGGVFRWLMLACGEDIEEVIQVGSHGYRIHTNGFGCQMHTQNH